MTDHVSDRDESSPEPGEDLAPSSGMSRRGLLAAGLGGAAVVGGLAGAGTAAATSGGGWRRETLRFDVACLGDTWRDSATRNPADDADFRVPFLVEGNIYPPDTVSDGFVPTDEGTIGRWFCQGWQILDGDRPEPHVSSRQTYAMGSITPNALFPRDLLVTMGLEGTFDDAQFPVRVVGGGTGMYLGATGQAFQRNAGANTTVFADGSNDPAPNFAFEFDLLMPDV